MPGASQITGPLHRHPEVETDTMFIIQDEIHSEPQEGRYDTFEEASVELRRRASLPWDEPPNRPPCVSWRTCERRYVIIDLESSRRTPFLQLSADNTVWLKSDNS